MEVLHELEDMIDAELIETLWNVNEATTEKSEESYQN